MGLFGDDLPRTSADIALLEGSPDELRNGANGLRDVADKLDPAAHACRELGLICDGTAWKGQGYAAYDAKVADNPKASDIENAQGNIRTAATTLDTLAGRLTDAQTKVEWCRKRIDALAIPESGDIPEDLVPQVEAIKADAEAAHEEYKAHLRSTSTAIAGLTEKTLYAKPPPSFIESAGHFVGEFLVGIAEGVWEIIKFNWTAIATLFQPWKWDDVARDIGKIVQFAIENPGEFLAELGKAIVDWDTLMESPGRWLGKLVPSVLLAVATGGTGALATGAGRLAVAASRMGRLSRLAGKLDRAATKLDGFDARANVFRNNRYGRAAAGRIDVATAPIRNRVTAARRAAGAKIGQGIRNNLAAAGFRATRGTGPVVTPTGRAGRAGRSDDDTDVDVDVEPDVPVAVGAGAAVVTPNTTTSSPTTSTPTSTTTGNRSSTTTSGASPTNGSTDDTPPPTDTPAEVTDTPTDPPTQDLADPPTGDTPVQDADTAATDGPTDLADPTPATDSDPGAPAETPTDDVATPPTESTNDLPVADPADTTTSTVDTTHEPLTFDATDTPSIDAADLAHDTHTVDMGDAQHPADQPIPNQHDTTLEPHVPEPAGHEPVGTGDPDQPTGDRLLDMARDVNPLPGGRDTNCSEVVLAMDLRLMGRANYIALPMRGVLTWRDDDGYLRSPYVESHYSSRFEHVPDLGDMERQLLEAGPGARGILHEWPRHSEGHFVNVVNDDGRIRYLDAQTGQDVTPAYRETAEYLRRPDFPNGTVRHDFLRTDGNFTGFTFGQKNVGPNTPGSFEYRSGSRPGDPRPDAFDPDREGDRAREAWGQAVDEATPAERDAVRGYAGVGDDDSFGSRRAPLYQRINDGLRGRRPLDAQAADAVTHLRSLTGRQPTPQRITGVRVTRREDLGIPLDEIRPGVVHRQKGFQSLTVGPDLNDAPDPEGDDLPDVVVLDLDIDPGVPAVFVDHPALTGDLPPIDHRLELLLGDDLAVEFLDVPRVGPDGLTHIPVRVHAPAPTARHDVDVPHDHPTDIPHDPASRPAREPQISQREAELRAQRPVPDGVTRLSDVSPDDPRLGEGFAPGTQDSYLVRLENGKLALYKPDISREGFHPPGYSASREVAMSRLAELFRMDDLVPTTTPWDGPDGPGSLMEWVDGTTPGLRADAYPPAIRERMAFLDYVGAHQERDTGNLRTREVDGQPHPVAIDNPLTFPDSHDPDTGIVSDFVAGHLDEPFSDDLLRHLRTVDRDEVRTVLTDAGLPDDVADAAVARFDEVLRRGRITGEAYPDMISDGTYSVVRPPLGPPGGHRPLAAERPRRDAVHARLPDPDAGGHQGDGPPRWDHNHPDGYDPEAEATHQRARWQDAHDQTPEPVRDALRRWMGAEDDAGVHAGPPVHERINTALRNHEPVPGDLGRTYRDLHAATHRQTVGEPTHATRISARDDLEARLGRPLEDARPGDRYQDPGFQSAHVAPHADDTLSPDDDDLVVVHYDLDPGTYATYLDHPDLLGDLPRHGRTNELLIGDGHHYEVTSPPTRGPDGLTHIDLRVEPDPDARPVSAPRHRTGGPTDDDKLDLIRRYDQVPVEERPEWLRQNAPGVSRRALAQWARRLDLPTAAKRLSPDEARRAIAEYDGLPPGRRTQWLHDRHLVKQDIPHLRDQASNVHGPPDEPGARLTDDEMRDIVDRYDQVPLEERRTWLQQHHPGLSPLSIATRAGRLGLPNAVERLTPDQARHYITEYDSLRITEHDDRMVDRQRPWLADRLLRRDDVMTLRRKASGLADDEAMRAAIERYDRVPVEQRDAWLEENLPYFDYADLAGAAKGLELPSATERLTPDEVRRLADEYDALSKGEKGSWRVARHLNGKDIRIIRQRAGEAATPQTGEPGRGADRAGQRGSRPMAARHGGRDGVTSRIPDPDGDGPRGWDHDDPGGYDPDAEAAYQRERWQPTYRQTPGNERDALRRWMGAEDDVNRDVDAGPPLHERLNTALRSRDELPDDFDTTYRDLHAATHRRTVGEPTHATRITPRADLEARLGRPLDEAGPGDRYQDPGFQSAHIAPHADDTLSPDDDDLVVVHLDLDPGTYATYLDHPSLVGELPRHGHTNELLIGDGHHHEVTSPPTQAPDGVTHIHLRVEPDPNTRTTTRPDAAGPDATTSEPTRPTPDPPKRRRPAKSAREADARRQRSAAGLTDDGLREVLDRIDAVPLDEIDDWLAEHVPGLRYRSLSQHARRLGLDPAVRRRSPQEAGQLVREHDDLSIAQRRAWLKTRHLNDNDVAWLRRHASGLTDDDALRDAIYHYDQVPLDRRDAWREQNLPHFTHQALTRAATQVGLPSMVERLGSKMAHDLLAEHQTVPPGERDRWRDRRHLHDKDMAVLRRKADQLTPARLPPLPVQGDPA